MDDILFVCWGHLGTHLSRDGSDLFIKIVDLFEKALFFSVELAKRVSYQFFSLLLQLAQMLFNARQSW